MRICFMTGTLAMFLLASSASVQAGNCCTPCVTTIPYWPDGWTQPTPRACRCGACQTPLLRALDLHPQRHERQRGIGR